VSWRARLTPSEKIAPDSCEGKAHDDVGDDNRSLATERVGDHAGRDLGNEDSDLERCAEQHELQRFEVSVGDEVDQCSKAISPEAATRQGGPPQKDADRIAGRHVGDGRSLLVRVSARVSTVLL